MGVRKRLAKEDDSDEGDNGVSVAVEASGDRKNDR